MEHEPRNDEDADNVKENFDEGEHKDRLFIDVKEYYR
jgi:hypothetical protein